MQQNKLHIVSFDVPYPADYGGAIDVFYKIKSLHDAGIDIYLHCFAYGRQETKELNKLCKEVWYYPRNTGIKGISLNKPYIVNSRKNILLLKRLQDNDAPVLFEGVHTTYYLNHPSLKNRKKAIRIHNIESDYYRQLATKESNLIKKSYYNIESSLLDHYERTLNNADAFFTLSIDDEKYFLSLYPSATHQFIAPFHPYDSVNSLTGSGNYCLYHGNLSHPENIEACLFLLNNVFNQIEIPFIVAGKNPSESIISGCKRLNHCQLISDPSTDEMNRLIANAHIHTMPTFQQSGMKLKLLYALFCGRHVVTTPQMLAGTGLNDLCTIAIDASDYISAINNLMQIDFSNADVGKRDIALRQYYTNTVNAQKIITWMRQ